MSKSANTCPNLAMRLCKNGASTSACRHGNSPSTDCSSSPRLTDSQRRATWCHTKAAENTNHTGWARASRRTHHHPKFSSHRIASNGSWRTCRYPTPQRPPALTADSGPCQHGLRHRPVWPSSSRDLAQLALPRTLSDCWSAQG